MPSYSFHGAVAVLQILLLLFAQLLHFCAFAHSTRLVKILLLTKLSVVVYNRTYSLIDVDELHFPWFAQIRPGPHIISAPVVPACVDLCIQFTLTISVKGKYVDPTQEARGH